MWVRSLGQGDSPGGGNGNPPQYSCLENPMDKGAWQVTVHGVAQSQTWLKQLSTCSKNSGITVPTTGTVPFFILLTSTYSFEFSVMNPSFLENFSWPSLSQLDLAAFLWIPLATSPPGLSPSLWHIIFYCTLWFGWQTFQPPLHSQMISPYIHGSPRWRQLLKESLQMHWVFQKYPTLSHTCGDRDSAKAPVVGTMPSIYISTSINVY